MFVLCSWQVAICSAFSYLRRLEKKRTPRNEVEKVHDLNEMATLLPNLEGKRFIYFNDYAITQASWIYYGKKEPCKHICTVVRLWSFLIVSILNTINMVLLWRKTVKSKILYTFLRIVNFILIYFQEELASLLSAAKPFSSNLESWKVTISPS